ncbi:DUF4174 domain-containing protein [uncultured Sphingomonas sp.]|mgnify:CR=1 FL=1|uniref:DUF4174 domain-containing protein n=1 Tax=uncultured Sphingomonas sp. TaxID=158754 RepID=UPI0025D614E8|nr:DUF4174 domain-containing protein [uncultured Sphingomonas sp.]
MRVLPLLLALLIAAPAAATSDDLRSVAGMRYHNRIVLAFTPTLGDPRLTAQRQAMARIGLSAAERDLILVQVDRTRVIGAHDKAAKLRQRFHVSESDFRALLIGKDGNVALASPGPIPARRLIQAIDAMPMRKAERRQAAARP